MKILLLLFSLFLIILQVDAICDPIEVSFEICNLDEICRHQMYIDMNGEDDFDTFTYLYNRLVDNTTLRDLVEDIVCFDFNNTLAVEMWISYMSNPSSAFCSHKNEYFDNYIKKCVCRPGKDCSHIKPRKALFHFDNYHFVGWALVFLDVILIISVWRRFIIFKEQQLNK